MTAVATRQDLTGAVRTVLEDLPPSGSLEPALRAFHDLGKPSEILPLLRNLGADDISPLVRFQSERLLKVVRAQASDIDFGSPPDPARVLEVLGSPNAESRTHAVKALRILAPEVAFPPLVEAIREEPDHWVLSSMVSLVGLKGTGHRKEAAELATAMLTHTSPRVAANALLALFALEPELGVPAARERLSDEDPRMRASAVMATYTSDSDLAWRHVLEMLESEKVWMRTSGSYLAAKLSHDDSERALLEALTKEDDPALVLRTLTWFGRQGSVACVDTLELIARLGEERYRPAAAKSLHEVRERIRTQASPERPLPPQVLESGFHLTNAIPVITQDAEGNPTVKSTGAQPLVGPISVPPPAADSPPKKMDSEDLHLPGQSSPPRLQEGQEESLDSEEDSWESETMESVDVSVSRSTDTFLKAMVDEELEGPIPNPVPGSPELPRGASLALAIPSASHGDRLESVAKFGSLLLLALIAVMGAHAAYTGATRPDRPPPDPAPLKPKVSPVGPLTQVKVRDGRLDLNAQPRAGTVGRWNGVVASYQERRLVLLTDAGVKIPFVLQEKVELPPKGGRIYLVGKVYRKARGGITLGPGVRIETDKAP